MSAASSSSSWNLCLPGFPTPLLIPKEKLNESSFQKELRQHIKLLCSTVADMNAERSESTDISRLSNANSYRRNKAEDAMANLHSSIAENTADPLFQSAWERVNTQFEAETELNRSYNTISQYYTRGAMPTHKRARSRADKGLEETLDSVETSLDQLVGSGSVLYDIWSQVASIESSECKKLVMEALDNGGHQLKSTETRTFIKDLLEDGQVFGPGCSDGAKLVRRALQGEVAKYASKPRPGTTDVLEKREGYFYAFESLVNDRKWSLLALDRLLFLWQELSDYFLDLRSESTSKKPCTPSFATPLLFLGAVKDKNAQEYSSWHDISVKVVTGKIRRMCNERYEPQEGKGLNSFSNRLSTYSEGACEHITKHSVKFDKYVNTGADEKKEMLKRAWERVKKQVDAESSFISREEEQSVYASEGVGSIRNTKYKFKTKVNKIGDIIQELRSDQVLSGIWVQVASIDKIAGHECQVLVEEAVEAKKSEVKKCQPRDFIRTLLEDGQTFGSHAKDYDLIIRRALLDEVAKYDERPSPSRNDVLENKDGIFYAFESFVTDKKWIFMQEERLQGIRDGMEKEGAFKQKEDDASGSSKKEGKYSGSKRKPKDNEDSNAAKKGKKVAGT